MCDLLGKLGVLEGLVVYAPLVTLVLEIVLDTRTEININSIIIT